MKRPIIPGNKVRATKQPRARWSASLDGVVFGTAREETGADLLEAAQEAEFNQQTFLDAAPVEKHVFYPEILEIYVLAKYNQVGNIENKLETLIEKQEARLKQTQASAPGRMSLPSTKRIWQNQQAQQQARLQTLHMRLDAVREIKDGMGLHSPKIEELATRRMRLDYPALATDWDSMREAVRRNEIQVRELGRKHQQKSQKGICNTVKLAERPE